jgi:hypothetical protein
VRILLLAILAVPGSRALAQRDLVQHERTLAPADARFEFVQSALGARFSFRVDKVTGRVDQIVMRSDSTLTWQRVPRLEHPAGDTQVPGHVNYQMFMSGIGNRYTYLLNLNNGATWQLVITKDELLAWEPIT